MNEFVTGRRNWMKSTATLLAAGLAGSRAGLLFAADADSLREAVSLVADPTKSLFRVRVEMEVEGNVNVPVNALISKEKSTQIPLKGKSVLDWEERVLGFADDRTVQAAERYYHEAHSDGTSGKTSRRTELRKESQYLMVRRNESKWVTYSPDSYLSGQELELLELPANSLAIDGMLPATDVLQGDTYKPDKEVLAKLLSLAAVNETDVTGEVNELSGSIAKIHLKGKVQGSVAGVPTVIDLVGKMVFDREAMCCNWLALAVREQRDIGKSEPGFDVSATIKMIRKPIDVPARLSAIPKSLPTGDIAAERLYCELSSSAVGYAALMDRRWKIMADAPGASMMRMIENDRGIAQCDIRPAGKMAAGTQLTLAAFVADVKQSLGKRLGQMLESREEVNDFGLRVLRATAQGMVEGVPVQWVFTHFSDDAGRRLLATMTVGGTDLETFAGSEVQLAASLRFMATEEELTEVATIEPKAAVK